MTGALDHRHQCEVRMLIAATRDAKRGRSWVRDYLDAPKVAGRREQLRADLNEQIQRGNTGGAGQWL